ncbi:ATP-binding protein [Pontiellaceae bacterium B12227]|nr:ATP-binding protein [Pontiellaceae bacterium B12227]
MKLFFKFKIALISFTVSAILLLTFGVAFFAYVYSSGIDRMDRELQALVESSMRAPHADQYWKNFGNSLTYIHGEDGEERIALVVIDPEERIIFRSKNAHPNLTRLSRPELAPSAQPTKTERDSERGFFRRNDSNKDGKVSRKEFDGPGGAFSHIDTDGDGFINRSEAKKLPSPRRRNGSETDTSTHPESHPGTPLPLTSGFATLTSVVTNWRVGIFRTSEATLIAALDMNSFNAEINRLRTAFMISVPLSLLGLGVLGWFLGDRAMKPVAAIAETAEGITAKGLDKRIPMIGNDIELERLVTVSNNMLDRLEKSYHQAVRFSADAAHELQTPLTILQGELDNAIQDSENGSTEQQRYSMLLEELRNLKAVVQKLLLLAHADEGRLNVSRQPVDLSDLITSAAEDIEIMAPALLIETHVPSGIQVQADPALLNQTIRNMTSNAAKYAEPGGRAVFTLEQDAAHIRFTLANSGPAIPDPDRPLLFQRFHRMEKSRTTAGSGLGLSLAREIARAHGGDLVLNPYKDGMVSFTLSLPA